MRAANQSGGRDNITVVLFRVADADGRHRPTEDTLSGEETIHRGLTADDVQAAVPSRSAPPPGAGDRRPRGRGGEPARRRGPAPSSRLRRVLAALVGLLVLAAGAGGRRISAARQVYFVGTDDAGLVTLYRGLPYDLPLGMELYSEQYASSVPAQDASRGRGASGCSTTSGAASADAEDLVRQLERGTLDTGSDPVSARTRELFGLIPVSLLVSAGFAAVLVSRTEDVSDATATYGLVFLGLCVFAHLFIRARLPDADPYLFPLAATLAAFGLVVIYRIDAELAREQAQWFVIGLIAFCATVVFLRDHHVLERYRYTIAAAGIALLVMPRVPGIGEQVNGAFLAVKVGPIQFQPAEFAKIAIIVFLASYLRDTGDVLVRARLRPLPVDRQALLFGGAALAVLLLVLVLDLSTAGTVLLAVFTASLGGDPARAAVAQALRAAAAGLGPGDADAAVHPRPRQLADVLRRLPGAAVRGHRAPVAGGGGRHDVPRRRHRLRQQREPRAGARGHLAGPVRVRAWWTTRATRSPSPCSRRPTAGYSARASARRCWSCRAARRSCRPPTPT